MTPAEAYAAMQGTDGLGQGLTTYPDSGDAEARKTHASCIALEHAGGCVRHSEGVNYAPGANASEGQRHVIWMPVAGATPPEPPPEIDNTLPPEGEPPADAPAT